MNWFFCFRLSVIVGFFILFGACNFKPGPYKLPDIIKTVSEIQGISVKHVPLMNKKQIQSLNPYFIEVLSQEQILAFRPEQVSWFTEEQIQFWTVEQISWLHADQIPALTPVQIKSMTSDQMYGFSTHQMAHFLPSQLQHMRPAQIQKLPARGFTGKQIQALNTEQLQAVLPEEVLQIKADAIKAWPVSSFSLRQMQVVDTKNLSREQVGALTSDQIQGFNQEQIFYAAPHLSPDQFHHIAEWQIQQIHPNNMNNMMHFHHQKFSPLQLSSLTEDQIKGLTHKGMPGSVYPLLTEKQIPFLTGFYDMNKEQVHKLTSAQLEAMTKEQVRILLMYKKVKYLTKEQIQGINNNKKLYDFMLGLSPDQMPYLTKAQIEVLPLNEISEEVGFQSGKSLLSYLTAEQIRWIPVSTLKKISYLHWPYFTSDQLEAMAPEQISVLDQIPNLNLVECCVSVGTEWVLPFNRKEQIQALSLKQIAGFLREVPSLKHRWKAPYFVPLSPEQVSYLTVQQLQSLKPEQIQVLIKEQIQAISPPHFGKLVVREASLPEGGNKDLSSEAGEIEKKEVFGQISAFTKKQIPFITLEQLKAMTLDQIKALSYGQVSAFTLQQAGVLSQAQYEVLSPESQVKISVLKNTSLVPKVPQASEKNKK